jgi:mRNA interferase MazF
MRRGDIVTVSTSGDYGKPRPAVVVQTDRLSQDYPSIILCPTTSDIGDLEFRILVEPDVHNGLKIPSQIMLDKIIGVARTKVGKKIGRLGAEDMNRLEQGLIYLLGLDEDEDA